MISAKDFHKNLLLLIAVCQMVARQAFDRNCCAASLYGGAIS
ncbi:hypothetical protein CHK_2294 [Christensenella hongkongensis]|uniref:Uncharacterized protein n=1 Tax=Christensenella hongkongensis TaxID=270498 RepID=A0A0M2NH06_9FIRM|nr:hypothetical protein CHK_2294 [Christensenella hongkongensis]